MCIRDRYENNDCLNVKVGCVSVYRTYYDDNQRGGRTGEKHLDELHEWKHRSSSTTKRSGSRSPQSRHHRRRSRSANRSVVSHLHSSSRSGRSGSGARLRSSSRSGSRSREGHVGSPDVDYKKLDRKTMAYATSLAAELRKRQMRLELKTGGAVRPRPKVNWSQNTTGFGTAEEPVIIIDDLSSPEDEVHSSDVRSMKDADAGSNKDLSMEPDVKKQKMESSDVGTGNSQALPPPIIDYALLSSIPMPTLPPSVPAVGVEEKCSTVMEEKLPEEKLVLPEKPSPEKFSPVPNFLEEQHSVPVDEPTTYPARSDQSISNNISSYAIRRLTELPMPPVAPDDDYESPSENSR